jgi:hypothetical protein
MQVNETLETKAQLEASIKSHEQRAQEHEKAARSERAAMEQDKLELSQLRRIINDAQIVQHVESSVKIAEGAREAALAAQTEARQALHALTAKEARIDAYLAKLEKAPDADSLLANSVEAVAQAQAAQEAATEALREIKEAGQQFAMQLRAPEAEAPKSFWNKLWGG